MEFSVALICWLQPKIVRFMMSIRLELIAGSTPSRPNSTAGAVRIPIPGRIQEGLQTHGDLCRPFHLTGSRAA